MKKLKKILASPAVAIASFALAAVLLLYSSVGGARAALTYFSEEYNSYIELSQIGVALLENGQATPDNGTLLTGLLTDAEGNTDSSVKLGKRYVEELGVRNTGSIDQYVRVRIYRYWKNAQGAKSQELSPKLIQLWLNGTLLDVDPDAERGYLEGNIQLKDASERSILARAALQEAGWLVDETTLSEERMDLYYTRLLPAGSEEGVTSLFADQLSIDGSVAGWMTEDETAETVGDKTYKTITRTYAYDGHEFWLEVKVDAVQDHNAEDAALSAWGRSISIDDGILSLR